MKSKFFLILILFFLDINSQKEAAKNILVFGGKTGWIGQKIIEIVKHLGHNVICASSRLENRENIIKEINLTKPNLIINAAGITGRPNVDWCEKNKEETIRTNLLGCINLIDIAFSYNIHVTNITTGCIYKYDEKHNIGSGIGFTEDDEPNFFGSFYSRTKILAEKIILEYPNVLNLRIKMPISYDFHPRSFIGKIIKYKKIIDVPNSMCVLEDLLPIAVDMTLKQIKGNFNFVNPGTISHNEILLLYKRYIDPSINYEIIKLEDHDKILKVERSNCELSAIKLLKLYPEIYNIKESILRLFETVKKGKNAYKC